MLQGKSQHLGHDSVLALVKATVAPEIEKNIFDTKTLQDESIETLVQIVIQVAKICPNGNVVYLCLPDEILTESVDIEIFGTNFLEPQLTCLADQAPLQPQLWPENAINFLTKV